jgi:hypothetical protein
MIKRKNLEQETLDILNPKTEKISELMICLILLGVLISPLISRDFGEAKPSVVLFLNETNLSVFVFNKAETTLFILCEISETTFIVLSKTSETIGLILG